LDNPSGNGGVGAAWVFTQSGGTWSQQGSKLTGGDESGNGNFGSSVALASDGNTAIVGGPHDKATAASSASLGNLGTAWTAQARNAE
jgi:FG-GAP repeat protein